jgi:hypothetical protein
MRFGFREKQREMVGGFPITGGRKSWPALRHNEYNQEAHHADPHFK